MAGEAAGAVPPLYRCLEPVFTDAGLVMGEAAASWSGPRRWWRGALDVEGLALGSVGAAAAALNFLTGRRGRFGTTAALAAAAFDSYGHLRIDGRKIQGFAPLSGFRRTRDGWIRLHANYPHHVQRLMQALDATTADGVAAALAAMSSLEAEAAIQARGGIAAAVRSRQEWLNSGMGSAARTGPWIDLRLAGSGSAGPKPRHLPGDDPFRPLAGVRVLDLTRVIAGPVSTRLLGSLGADVLRLDPPGLPEITDQFVDTGFGKRSAEADLATPGNRHLLEQLLATADVVITGYRRGSLNRFGLEPEMLLAVRPELVVVTLDSWGIAGPWSGLRGFDSIVQAATGIAELYGAGNHDGEWQPGALPVQALDHATGYGVAAAAIALLARRRHKGLGGSARLSLARTAEELFALPEPGLPRPELPAPELCTMASTYGELRYAGPPLLVDGQPLDYPGPPAAYGSSALAWA
ncbi:crotonobetainyl-CoA:carnitine CoA-transferase CaiB-like acyl-CoA transferase [Pseudarthrobacter siccitolerans]|uniref:Crotonobetainyl-CoA:carnitine CoA-transferase CaiB-like acyl-CoA transferase n=1 Tax=Pseudarthrobacter siccitolerans TaxID=861266 RepID=A0ABU0PPP4_9MICC|nr:CoA transferase [Pseudarthrobacter siccitolerans]MDQ0675527.1 crotonobetainyl-CoA:carnitine CoA-transferase CaiB-like acyl-CoA transferase [Pseudarthrobacter siccitolerans]